MHALVLAFLLQASSADAGFRPVLHHGQKTPDEWSAELEASGGRSTRAVWALHYSGDRSQHVVDVLQRWIRDSPDPDARRAIDTVLIHWELGDTALTAREYAAPGPFVAAEDVLPAPPLLEERSTEDLLGELATGDALRLASAAAALLRRKEAVDRALVALSDSRAPAEGETWSEEPPDLATRTGLRRWALDHGGSAYVRALGAALEAAVDEERRGALLEGTREDLGPVARSSALLQALENTRGNLGPAAQSLEHLLEKEDARGQKARELWKRAAGLFTSHTDGEELRDWALHAFRIDRPGSPEVQASIERVFSQRVERAMESGGPTLELLQKLHLAVLRSAPLAERMKPLLDQLLEGEEPLATEALKILCHLRAPTLTAEGVNPIASRRSRASQRKPTATLDRGRPPHGRRSKVAVREGPVGE